MTPGAPSFETLLAAFFQQNATINAAMAQQNSTMLTTLTQALTSAVTPQTPKEHPQGNAVSLLFPNVSPSIIHKILLKKFTVGDLPQLGRNLGDTVDQPRMHISNDGLITPLEGTKAAKDAITNLPFLIRCLSTWWAIKSYRHYHDHGTPPHMDLLSGWQIFITRLLQWHGTGSPHNYSFDGIRAYAITLLSHGLDDDTFNFGTLQTHLATEHVFSRTNAQARPSAPPSFTNQGAGPSSCHNWNVGKPCFKTPCHYPHVCKVCSGPHKSIDHPSSNPTPQPKKP
jgi:hypothetical protein